MKRPYYNVDKARRILKEAIRTGVKTIAEDLKTGDKTMKYKVKTDLLEQYEPGDQISDSRKQRLVQEGCPESWFQPVDTVQEGEWVVADGNWEGKYLFRYGSEDEGYFSSAGDFTRALETNPTGGYKKDSIRKATVEEIKTALTEEAKRRYSVGNIVKPVSSINIGNRGNKDPFKVSLNDFTYYRGDQLYDGNILLYEGGEWANIIDSKPTIEINGYKAEIYDAYTKVGCRDVEPFVFKTLASHVKMYGLKIYREGEDITEQIKQIASHYE